MMHGLPSYQMLELCISSRLVQHWSSEISCTIPRHEMVYCACMIWQAIESNALLGSHSYD